jgi:uncharacterized protein
MSGATELAQSMYEAFGRGDIPTVLASLHPDVEWNEAEHVTLWNGSAFRGPDAVVQGVFMRLGEMFGDTFRIEIGRLLGCGDTVVMEGRYVGTALATGRSFSAQVAHVLDFDGEQLVRFQQYTDTWLWAEVTGVEPSTAG